ncbi:MAG TPA: hypothetical protein PK069_05790 [Methanolinea sp.]|nr:hypothetical protein [Methanolinea sp.]HQK56449.1 hypothetical protein [Methanolinea sp.]
MLRCPSCGSRDVYCVVGGYIGQIYRCKSCGYRGSLIMECERPKEREPGKGRVPPEDPGHQFNNSCTPD